MSNRLRSRCALLGVALLGFFVLEGCRSPQAKGANGPAEDEIWLTAEEMKKANVQMAEAAKREVDRFITVGGRVTFDDLRVTHMFSPVTGRVTKVLAQPGERVKKGTPLVSIVSPEIGTAVSDVLKAQADLTSTERDFHRQEALFAAQAAPRRDFENAEDNYHKAQAEFQRADKKLQLLRVRGDLDTVNQEYTLRSPIDGEIVLRSVNPGIEVQGQYSGGNSGEMFTVGELDQVWVIADVPDQDFHRVKKDAEVSLRVVAQPGKVYQGKVDWISSTLDPVLRTGKVRCVLPNPNRELKAEMYATVTVSVPGKNTLSIPREAIVHITDQTFVFVPEGQTPDGRSRFKRRRVVVSEDDEAYFSVLSGLTDGEQVVIRGSISPEAPNDEVWITEEQHHSALVKLAVIEEQTIDQTISVGGRITFDDLNVTRVFSPVNGRITQVLANLGERVSVGAALVKIVSPDVGSSVSDLMKARADLTAAQHEYRRQQELFAARASSQKDFDTAESNFRKAKAEHERAQQKAQLLRTGTVDEVKQEYTLRSRIAGEVISRNVNPGAEVQGLYSGASNPQELFTIGKLDPIWVLADVYEMNLASIKKDAVVSVKLPAFPDETFSGKVDWISAALDPVARTARVRCILANPNHKLKPEMYQRVSISVAGQKLLAIPRRSVLRLGGQTVVFVAAGRRPDGKFVLKQRPVVVNEEQVGDLLPVIDGLQSGETIVVQGAILLAGLL
jgi:cobalt-zinc-cadmium efflux system membrane fusion protein